MPVQRPAGFPQCVLVSRNEGLMAGIRPRYAVAFAVSLAAHAAILIAAGRPPSSAMPSGAVRISVSVSAPSETVPTRQKAQEVREADAPEAKEAVTPDADAPDRKPDKPKPEREVAETPPTPEATRPEPAKPEQALPARKRAEAPTPPKPVEPVKPETVAPAAPPAPAPAEKAESRPDPRRPAAAETRLTANRESEKDASVKAKEPVPDPDAPRASAEQPPKPMPAKPAVPPKPPEPPKQIAEAQPEKRPEPKPALKPSSKPKPTPKKVVEKPKAKPPVKTRSARRAAPRRAPKARKQVHRRAAAPVQRSRRSKSRQVTAPNKTRTTDLDKPAQRVGKQTASRPGPTGHIPTMRSVRFLRPPRPAHYPKLSLERDEQGTVIVRALVGANGRPQRVRVVRSSGYGRLDASALQAVRGWAFVPMRVNGAPTMAWVQIPVRFRIR